MPATSLIQGLLVATKGGLAVAFVGPCGDLVDLP